MQARCHSGNLFGGTGANLAGVAMYINNASQASSSEENTLGNQLHLLCLLPDTIWSPGKCQILGGKRLHADAGEKQAIQEVVDECTRVFVRLPFPPLQVLHHAKVDPGNS